MECKFSTLCRRHVAHQGTPINLLEVLTFAFCLVKTGTIPLPCQSGATRHLLSHKCIRSSRTKSWSWQGMVFVVQHQSGSVHLPGWYWRRTGRLAAYSTTAVSVIWAGEALPYVQFTVTEGLDISGAGKSLCDPNQPAWQYFLLDNRRGSILSIERSVGSHSHEKLLVKPG